MADKKAKHYSGIEIYLYRSFDSKKSIEKFFGQNNFLILVLKSGHLGIHINISKIELGRNELLIIPANVFCEIITISKPVQICSFAFTDQFAQKSLFKRSHIAFFEFYVTKYPSKVSLKDKEALRLVNLLSLLKNISKRPAEDNYKEETLLLAFNLMFYELAEKFIKHYQKLAIRHSVKEQLVLQFFKILEIYCREQHSVKFYSDSLFVTAGYLTKILKMMTLKTAKQLIDEAIIDEARLLLRNEDLTISVITEELHFHDVSLFSNFFKKHTSMSPSEYRVHLHRPRE